MADEVTLKIKIDGNEGKATTGGGGDAAAQSRRDSLLAKGQQVALITNTVRALMSSKKPTEVVIVGSRIGGIGPVTQGGVIGMSRQPGGGYLLPRASTPMVGPGGLLGVARNRLPDLRASATEPGGLLNAAGQRIGGLRDKAQSLITSGGTGALSAGRALVGRGLSAAGGTFGGAAAGTVGSLATGAMSALGPLAAVAAGAVGVTIAFKAVSATAAMLSENFKKRADELAEYSAAIQRSRANTEIRQIQRDIKNSETLGEPLSRYEDSTSRIGSVFDSFAVTIENIFLRLVNPILERIAGLLEIFVPILDGIDGVVKFLDNSGVLQLITDGMSLMGPIYSDLRIIAKLTDWSFTKEQIPPIDELLNAGEAFAQSAMPSQPSTVGTPGIAPSFG